MKTLHHGVLEGLISFCEGVKNTCKTYGFADDDKRVILRGAKVKDVVHLSTVPDNFVEEVRRMRSMNGTMSRLGYDPLILKYYRSEMRSKVIFDE
jgi:hypothetical protein